MCLVIGVISRRVPLTAFWSSDTSMVPAPHWVPHTRMRYSLNIRTVMLLSAERAIAFSGSSRVMNTQEPDSSESRKEQHERVSKLFGGYTAFVAALLVATFAKSHDYPRSWIVISLLALSLPSLVAFNLLDFTIRVIQGRRGSAFRGLSFALGCLPSLAAVSILIGHFFPDRLHFICAANLFLVSCP